MKKKVKKVKKYDSSKAKSIIEEKDFHFCVDSCVCHPIDNYYVYQTPHVIKVHVIIPGIENVPKSKIKIKFKEDYFELSIFEWIYSNYHLKFGQLSYEIIPSMCKYFIRKDKIIIEIAKEIPRLWRSIETIQKGFWLGKFCKLLEDIPEVTYVGHYGDNLWDEIIRLKELEFDFLSPPIRLHKYVPALREHSTFSSLEEALRFYKAEIKKDCFNEALFVLYGFTLMKKMRVDRFYRNPENPEGIEESIFMSRKFLQKCKKTEKVDNETFVETLKAEGNILYRSGRIYAALQMYLEALKLSPENYALYFNASAAYYMLGLYHDALRMVHKSVQFNSSFRNGYIRIARCNLILGHAKAALKAYDKAKELGKSKDLDTEMMKVHKLNDYIREEKLSSECEDYFLALDCSYNAHCLAHANTTILMTYIENQLRCDQPFYVKMHVKTRREQNPDDSYSHLMLGMLEYYADNREGALSHFDEATKANKGDQQITNFISKANDLFDKQINGNDSFKQKKYDEAMKYYQAALEVDPQNKVINAKIHYNVALIYIQQNKIDDAIASLTKAINLKCMFEKAFLKRAALYQKKKLYSKAVQDLKRTDFQNPSEASKKRLEEAQTLMNKKYKKNYYQILHIQPTATAEEMRYAYDKLVKFHHPENVGAVDNRKMLLRVNKEILEAYNVLKDPVKREKYDKEHGNTFAKDNDDEDDIEELEFRKFLFTQYIEERTANITCLLETDDESSEEDDDYDEMSDDDDDDDDDYDDDVCYCNSASEESVAEST